MKKKKVSNKLKKVTISLSSRDFEKLTRYAKSQKILRPLAAKRLLRAQLSTISFEKVDVQPKNQLGLFDSLQIDIFNGTSKTES